MIKDLTIIQIFFLINAILFFKINKTNKMILTGEDRRHLLKYDKSASIIIMTFKNRINIDILNKDIINFFNNYQIHVNPLNFKITDKKGNYIYNKYLRPSEFINESIIQKKINNIEEIYQEYDWHLPIKFIIDNNVMYIMCNHSLIDGVIVQSFMQFMWTKDKNIFEYLNKNKFQYSIPKNPSEIIYKLKNLFKIQPEKMNEENEEIHFTIKTNIVKELKNKNKSSFVSSLLSLIIIKYRHLFPNKKIFFGISGAFIKKNTFNNYGMNLIYLDMTKYKNIDSIDNLDKEIYKQNSDKSLFSITNYLSNTNINFNRNKVYCLISPTIITNDTVSINEDKITNFQLSKKFHSNPLYIYSGTIGENIYISINSRIIKNNI